MNEVLVTRSFLRILSANSSAAIDNITTTANLNGSNGSSDSDDDGFPIYVAVCIGLVVGWFCCCCITTKGCTDCSYRDRPVTLSGRDEEVWGRHGSLVERDRQLALRLQAQEREQHQRQRQQGTPEEQEQERQRRIAVRTNFVKKNLQSYPYSPGSNHGSKRHRAVSMFSTNLSSSEASSSASYCSICIEKFQPLDAVTKSTVSDGYCRHEFHYDCIVPWLTRSAKCPICRETFMKEDWQLERREETSGEISMDAPVEQTTVNNGQQEQEEQEDAVAVTEETEEEQAAQPDESNTRNHDDNGDIEAQRQG